MTSFKEFEVPFKNGLFCYSSYGLIETLVKNGVAKSKAIVIVDNIVNHHKVILRPVFVPRLTFRQIHSRKTKSKPDLHIQMPKQDYKKLKLFFKQMQTIPLFTITKKQDATASLLGWANDFLKGEKEK